jgi:Zn-dependent M28 family amino/carboxypeptidase
VADLGAETVEPGYADDTDHVPFDAVGIPAFEFIQEPLDYLKRTHHSNQDVLARVSPENLEQAAVVLATVVYEAATLDQRVQRKQ